jgi:hypothetical protein
MRRARYATPASAACTANGVSARLWLRSASPRAGYLTRPPPNPPARGKEEGPLRKAVRIATIPYTSLRYIVEQIPNVRGELVKEEGSRGRRGERSDPLTHLYRQERPPTVAAALTLVRDLMGDGERERLRLMTRACWRRTLSPPRSLAQPEVGIVPPLSDSGLLLAVDPVPTVVFGLRRWEFGTMREHNGPCQRRPRPAEPAPRCSAVAGLRMPSNVVPRSAKRG